MPRLSKKAYAQQSIRSWKEFEEVRISGDKLLQRLDEFPDSVLVTGCQRSGTTMLARIITKSKGMRNYWFGPDDELDAALILSGRVEHQPQGRYCFQTTYIDDRYPEYFEHFNGHQIIWVVRNPFSVIYSLLYNWPERALHSSFHRCGLPLLPVINQWIYKIGGDRIINRVQQACLLYNGKLAHLFELRKKLGDDKLMIVDYDNLVLYKEEVLPQIYRFIGLDYDADYADQIHSQSLKKRTLLSEDETLMVKRLSEPVYLQAKQMAQSQATAVMQ